MLPELPWYWPDAQERHAEELVAPLLELYCPLPQERQAVLPELLWYWPDAQERHAEELVAPDPAAP